MKTLLRVMVAALCITAIDAATIRIFGTLNWKITKPDCTFKLDGAIQNLSPYPSGPLKMILWATPTEFPSTGYAVAQYNLGPLAGGYQFNNFRHKVPVYMPQITGSYYFTVSIVEYTGSGWLNRDYVTTGKKRLDNGQFMTGSKWLAPVQPIVPPPDRLLVGQQIVLAPKADEDFDQISSGTIAKTTVTIKRRGKARVGIAGDIWSYFYTYAPGKGTLYNEKKPVGRLYLDPEDFTGSSTINLFFQSPTSGIYKNVEENPDGGGTTWGTFSLK